MQILCKAHCQLYDCVVVIAGGGAAAAAVVRNVLCSFFVKIQNACCVLFAVKTFGIAFGWLLFIPCVYVSVPSATTVCFPYLFSNPYTNILHILYL